VVRFIDGAATSPSCVQDGDAVILKVVGIAGFNNDWAAYCGPSDWSDEMVAEQGSKLAYEQVESLFYVFKWCGRRYRR